MPVKLQGSETAWSDALLARAQAQIANNAILLGQNAHPAILKRTFNGLAATNRSFITTGEFFTALIAAYPAALAADRNDRLMVLRAQLISRAQIMQQMVHKIVKYNDIPLPYKNCVSNVITSFAHSGRPSFPHLTDPVTGLPHGAVHVWEYYLPNAAGRRMTCRNENGKLAFYYSNGMHGQNQYYYHLITNQNEQPILRGGYPADLHLPI